jgi:hypothetical protein
MSVASEHYPDIHALVERLRPEKADEARQALLRLVEEGGQPSRVADAWVSPSLNV